MQPTSTNPSPSRNSISTVRSGQSTSLTLETSDPTFAPSPPQSISQSGPHAAYILLAEFDIDTGSGLKHQYPSATGTSEHMLADLMLPDGAHDRTEDWTVFFLNQTPRLTVETDTSVIKSSEPSIINSENGEGVKNNESQNSLTGNAPTFTIEQADTAPNERKLLYVISLVRTKKDTTVRRGAICKALAVCSPHPFIQIFKPILLLALEDYFVNPSIDCLAQLYHALNTMDISGMPKLSHFERVVLRCSERPDLFEEKFAPSMTRDSSEALPLYVSNSTSQPNSYSISTPPTPSSVTMTKRLSGPLPTRPPMPSSSSFASSDQKSTHSIRTRNRSSTIEDLVDRPGPEVSPPARTASNIAGQSDELMGQTPPLTSSSTFGGSSNGSSPPKRPKDTHFYDTKIDYSGKSIPVRIPLQTFPEEVGDYSLIQLVQTFSSPNALTYNAPLHPHLHTSGIFTHPIILLFNALVTQKRIVFLGHGLPAGVVSQMVLAACALGSGCGGVLEGYTERAFPYSNLTIYDDFKAVPGYIAGVTNPIFELHTEAWDVFCNIETGKIIISKDIMMPSSISRSFTPALSERTLTEFAPPSAGLVGASAVTPKLGAPPEDPSRAAGTSNGPASSGASLVGVKQDVARESADQIFMEDIISAIHSHFGEPIIRARFQDYVRRFVRVASKWEEDQFGSSSIGVKTKAFTVPSSYLNTTTLEEKIEMLGSGPVFSDEYQLKRELQSNTPRIEAWRETRSYRLYRQRYARGMPTNFSFDAQHQLSRIRVCRKIPEVEVQAMYEVLVAKVQSHHEIIEILSHAAPYLGGLSPFAFGLFHASDRIRTLSVEFIRRIESHPTGQKFFQGLNSFHKLAYQRLAHYYYQRNSLDNSFDYSDQCSIEKTNSISANGSYLIFDD